MQMQLFQWSSSWTENSMKCSTDYLKTNIIIIRALDYPGTRIFFLWRVPARVIKTRVPDFFEYS